MTGIILKINFFVYFKNKVCRLIFCSTIVLCFMVVYIISTSLNQSNKAIWGYSFMSYSSTIVNFLISTIILFLAYFFQSLDTQNRFDVLRKSLPVPFFDVILGRLITILILVASVWIVYAFAVCVVLSKFGYKNILSYLSDYILIPQSANILYIVIVVVLSFYLKNWIWGFFQLFFCNILAFFKIMMILPSSFAIQTINPINTLNLFPDTDLVQVPIFYIVSPILSCLLILIFWIYEKRIN